MEVTSKEILEYVVLTALEEIRYQRDIAADIKVMNTPCCSGVVIQVTGWAESKPIWEYDTFVDVASKLTDYVGEHSHLW